VSRHLVTELKEGKVYRSKYCVGDLMLVTRVLLRASLAELEVCFVWVAITDGWMAERYLGQEHCFFASARSKDMYEEWEP
jgi:hypothetical protein